MGQAPAVALDFHLLLQYYRFARAACAGCTRAQCWHPAARRQGAASASGGVSKVPLVYAYGIPLLKRAIYCWEGNPSLQT